MPIPRKFDRRPPERDETRINEMIRVPQVRLIGDDGNQIGVVSRDEALSYARERDLDLVEVAADARPPVCRVLDYSKYKYEQEQKAKAARKHQKQVHVREIKLRPKIATQRLRDEEGPRAPLPRRGQQGQGHDHVPRPRDGAPGARRGPADEARRGRRGSRRRSSSVPTRTAAT